MTIIFEPPKRVVLTTIRIDPDLLDDVDQIAEKVGVSRSELLRQMVAGSVQDYRRRHPKPAGKPKAKGAR